MFLHACLLVGMISASVIASSFYYRRPEFFRRTEEVCTMCYGTDCQEIDQATCQYYVETNGILRGSDDGNVNNTEVAAEVDTLMHKFIAKASVLSTECIPLVSSYTDCQKENIYTGCRSCECDAGGRWRCSIVQRCRANPKMNINHRVLLIVIENLMQNFQNTRFKRSVQKKQDENATKISFEEISQWLHDVDPLADREQQTATEEPQHNTTETDVQTEPSINIVHTTTNNILVPSTPDTIEPDYLAFDEVISSLTVDNKNYTKKLSSDTLDNTALDYMIFDDYNKTGDDLKSSDEFWRTSDAVIMDHDVTTPDTKEVTKGIIDLLETSKNNSVASNKNSTDYMDDIEKKYYIDPVMENSNYLELNSINVMKRRDLSTTNNSIIEKYDIKVDESITNTTVELKNDILFPLGNLINAKQKELEDLLRISENLIKYVKSNNEVTDSSLPEQNEIDTNSTINIYKLEVVPDNDVTYDLRRTNTNLVEKMLNKLKLDVYEVIKDIVAVQRHTNLTKLPQDLNILIRAMKSYVRSQKDNLQGHNMQDLNENSYSRRYGGSSDEQYSSTIIDNLVSILQVVDKNKPVSNALAGLSDTSKKILKRIINNNINELGKIGFKVIDLNYNLTSELENIGLKWQEMIKYVTQNTILDRLHAMKLIHLILSTDIENMNDALALIDFLNSRRISSIDSKVSNDVIDKINHGLRSIKDKIKLIIKFHNKRILSKNNSTKTYNLQKKSFFNRIKNILRNSKKDIVSFMKRKIKKNKLAKELARQKLDDITRRRFAEFEETMKKWQSNLNLNKTETERDKRSLTNVKYKNRIKNILPKYLSGKVNPAIAAKVTKKMNLKQNKKLSKL